MTGEAKDRRTNGVGESTVTVKWWGVLLFIAAVCGYFFSVGMAHEQRLTKIETSVEVKLTNIEQKLCDMKTLLDKHMDKGK